MSRKSRNVPSLHEGRPAALLLLGRRLRVRRRVALRRRGVAGRRVAVLPRVACMNQVPNASEFSRMGHGK